MNEFADLQAQVVALRMAVEGAWLSLMSGDPDGLANAARMRSENVQTVDQIVADTAETKAMRDAVRQHTDRLWGSIEWQLKQLRGEG